VIGFDELHIRLRRVSPFFARLDENRAIGLEGEAEGAMVNVAFVHSLGSFTPEQELLVEGLGAASSLSSLSTDRGGKR
jgi:hypothetical protein